MEGDNTENNKASESPNENGQKPGENVENNRQELNINEIGSSNAKEEAEGENHGGEPSVIRSSTSNKESFREKMKTNESISTEKDDGSESQNEDVQIISDEPSGTESSFGSYTVDSNEPHPSKSRCRYDDLDSSDSTGSVRRVPRKKPKLNTTREKKPKLNTPTERMSTDGSEGDDEDELDGNGKFTDDGFEILYGTGTGSEEFYPILDNPANGELQSRLAGIDISRTQNGSGLSATIADLPSDNHLYYAINQTIKLEQFAESVARFIRFSGKFSISDAQKIAQFTHSMSEGLYDDVKSVIWHLNENKTPKTVWEYSTEGYVITYNGKCSSKCSYWCSTCRICSHEYSCSCSQDAKNLMWCHHLHAAVLHGIFHFTGPIFAVFITQKGTHYQGMVRFDIKKDVRVEKPWVLQIRDNMRGKARLEKFHKPRRNYVSCPVCTPLQRCALCLICRHCYGCTCESYSKDKLLCEHCHFAHKYFKLNASQPSTDSDDEIGYNGDKIYDEDKDKADNPHDKADDCSATEK